MSTLLAQLPGPGVYSSVGWILLALAALCVAANQVHGFLDRVKDKPAPADLQSHVAAHFATKEEVRQVREDVDDLRNELGTMREQILAAGQTRADAINEHIERVRLELKADTVGIHRRVDDILAAVAELKGRLQT
ncbi:MAG TPA: hypothetical protein VNO52_15850 [Methylomirabilota bacterium]|nr:hypothetical protein [Methylomirabilota bacterium]